jgi:PIN domain nuclease of toxin-antitoxin system
MGLAVQNEGGELLIARLYVLTPYRRKTLLSPIREAVPLTSRHARLVGVLVAQTHPLGLSLCDRACLALALAAFTSLLAGMGPARCVTCAVIELCYSLAANVQDAS